VGNSIGLPGLWVLFAITVGGGLWGILGMIVGVPLVSVLYAVMLEKVKREESKEKEVESKF
jgi:predicted PurR-regulated permease PerM